jgi:hypothetical protein
LRDGLEGLDRAKLRDRALETSPSGYLTAVSIIQGVVFALLASAAFQQRDSLSVETPTLVIQSIAVVLFLIVVFHFYVMSSMFLRWAPSILDSAFPFLVAATEVPTAHFVSRAGSWVVSTAIFFGVSGLGALSTTIFASATHFGRVDAWASFRRLLFGIAVGCFGVSLLLIMWLMFTSWLSARGLYAEMAPGILCVSAMLAIAVALDLGSGRLYSIYGLFSK